MKDWQDFLDERERRQLLRRLVPSSGRAPALAVREGREYVDFSSNDYLGLSSHPALVAAAREALDRFGVGSGASRLMSGDLAIHHELEDGVAVFKGCEAALVFNSGYQANTGILPALFGDGTPSSPTSSATPASWTARSCRAPGSCASGTTTRSTSTGCSGSTAGRSSGRW